MSVNPFLLSIDKPEPYGMVWPVSQKMKDYIDGLIKAEFEKQIVKRVAPKKPKSTIARGTNRQPKKNKRRK